MAAITPTLAATSATTAPMIVRSDCTRAGYWSAGADPLLHTYLGYRCVLEFGAHLARWQLINGNGL
jgi:hypothetical protein